ncbi:MAG TPA: YiiX/YebB-like N1pC/P60 family cysteine hydrolase [Flavipsychrobacter sp.]|nr:YiiX/YebB-like N1pC/P60 family cysteine hydrolase [Flavipsychrobacter sp.]
MKHFLTVVILLWSTCSSAQLWRDFKYQSGDLVFQDLDCGALCDAIEAVTPALGQKHFSHVGLVYVARDSIYVIEAIDKDVHLTSIQNFLNRQRDTTGNPKVVVGRLKKAHQRLNARALGFALQQRGKPYDDAFLYNNGKYYCSELIYDAYLHANEDRPFFNLYPMTFMDPATGKTYPVWKTYFKNLKMTLPEGKQGCNPGSIAISDAVEIVAEFY